MPKRKRKNVTGRKKRVYWTDEETVALQQGYDKHGRKWTEILLEARHKFNECRTRIDLRDKYDGMTEKMTSTKSSGKKYKGVVKKYKKFHAQISIDGDRQHLGTFDTAREAAKAWDRAAIKGGRPTSKLNFPNVKEDEEEEEDSEEEEEEEEEDSEEEDSEEEEENADAYNLAAIQAKYPTSSLNSHTIITLQNILKYSKVAPPKKKKRKLQNIDLLQDPLVENFENFENFEW